MLGATKPLGARLAVGVGVAPAPLGDSEMLGCATVDGAEDNVAPELGAGLVVGPDGAAVAPGILGAALAIPDGAVEMVGTETPEGTEEVVGLAVPLDVADGAALPLDTPEGAIV